MRFPHCGKPRKRSGMSGKSGAGSAERTIRTFSKAEFFTLCVGYLKNDCLFQRVSLKYHRQIVRTLYLFLKKSQFHDMIYLQFVTIPKTHECEDDIMAVSYKKLWKLLIDKDMKKKDLAEKAHISTYTIHNI